jgi:hypothetical protein
LKPSKSLRAFRRPLFAVSFVTVLLCLFPLGALLSADEEADSAKISFLNKEVAELYQAGKFNEAIPIAQEALELSEKALGPDHPDTATALNNLALLYVSVGDYAKAEPLYQRSLKIREKALGPETPDTAAALNNLANLAELYRSMGDYAKAVALYQRALKIKEKTFTGTTSSLDDTWDEERGIENAEPTPEDIQVQPSPQPTAIDQPRRTDAIERTPHVDYEPRGWVKPGTKIRVSIYADTNAKLENEEPGASLSVPVSPEIKDVSVVVYLLLSEEFTFSTQGEPDSKELLIHRDQPVSEKVTFDVWVENNAKGMGYITALFFYQGYPCGRVKRAISIGIPSQSETNAATAKKSSGPSNATVTSSLTIPQNGPDMTIVVIRTDSTRYQYFILAPQAENPRSDVYEWKNYANPASPKQTLESYYSRFGRDYEPSHTRNTLVSLGKELFKKAPPKVKDTLLSLIENKHAPRTVLVFSDEPYFAWELMIPYGYREQKADEPLGVMSAVGRWTSDPSETFRSPARYVPVRKSIFWAPDYVTAEKLKSADEKQVLQDLTDGKPIDPPTYDRLCETLSESDATVLHFICHGTSGSEDGLPTILAQEKAKTRRSESEPPEGEAPRKEYYRSDVTAGEIATCKNVQHFFAKRPLIFLNACQVGQTVQTMTGTGGFGPQFLQMNAGAVIAPLWSVFNFAAEPVAKQFYTTMHDNPGVPFAKILQQIREKAYTGEPPEGLSTYAAYCFYGDPLAAPSPSANTH